MHGKNPRTTIWAQWFVVSLATKIKSTHFANRGNSGWRGTGWTLFVRFQGKQSHMDPERSSPIRQNLKHGITNSLWGASKAVGPGHRSKVSFPCDVLSLSTTKTCLTSDTKSWIDTMTEFCSFFPQVLTACLEIKSVNVSVLAERAVQFAASLSSTKKLQQPFLILLTDVLPSWKSEGHILRNVACEPPFQWVGKSLQISFYRSNPPSWISQPLKIRSWYAAGGKNKHPHCSVIYTQLCRLGADPWGWCQAGVVLLFK